jgi:ATPase subunit of ABC transporter with duplicated ATPase domains
VAAARAFRDAAAAAEAATAGVERQGGKEAAAAVKVAQASLARATDGMEASGGWRLQQEVEEVTKRMGVDHLMKRPAESLSGEHPSPKQTSHPLRGT